MSYKLSACIVAYNNYEDVMGAIESLEKYTSITLEKKIYIVDNGVAISNHDDVIKFKESIQNYKDIYYIDAGENKGFGKGHNFVLDIIDSEYHAIINPDIIFCEDALTKIINWMDEHQDIGMVIPEIVDKDGERQKVYRNELTVFDVFIRFFCKSIFPGRVKKHTLQNMDFTKPFQVPFGQGSFLVIKSKLFKTLKGFDDNYFMYVEDADLCKRVNQISKFMYYPGARVIHKWGRESHRNKMLFIYHTKSMWYYFKKWGVKWF